MTLKEFRRLTPEEADRVLHSEDTPILVFVKPRELSTLLGSMITQEIHLILGDVILSTCYAKLDEARGEALIASTAHMDVLPLPLTPVVIAPILTREWLREKHRRLEKERFASDKRYKAYITEKRALRDEIERIHKRLKELERPMIEVVAKWAALEPDGAEVVALTERVIEAKP